MIILLGRGFKTPVAKTTPERSANMSRIRSKDTKPEMLVRKALHRLGFRFRLHVRELPGRPDIVLLKHQAPCYTRATFLGQSKHSIGFANGLWDSQHREPRSLPSVFFLSRDRSSFRLRRWQWDVRRRIGRRRHTTTSTAVPGAAFPWRLLCRSSFTGIRISARRFSGQCGL